MRELNYSVTVIQTVEIPLHSPFDKRNNGSLGGKEKSLLFCMTPLLKEHCPKVKDISSEHREVGTSSKKINTQS